MPITARLGRSTTNDGVKQAIALFQRAAVRVPAYKEFLAEHGVDPRKVKTAADLAKVPATTKDNYFRKYLAEGRMNDLLWDGDFSTANSFSLTSGSTGDRFAFPAGQATLDVSYGYLETILKGFGADTKPTLVINCFTMGLWAAGTFMDHAFKILQGKGYPVHILSPGLNREEALGAIRTLSPYFDQVLICAYPTAAVKLINEGILAGMDWKSLNLKFIHGGDAFNESFREGLLELVGQADDDFSVANVYASSEVYLVGHETEATIALRKLMAQDPSLNGLLPGNTRYPSVQEFDPTKRYIEEEEGKIVMTVDSAMPLLRYNTGDDGGVWAHTDIKGLDGLTVAPSSRPYVYVYGRGIKTLTIWALNLYPEHIEAALENPRIRGLVTRNYLSRVVRNDALEEVFELDIELAPNIMATDAIRKELSKTILKVLTTVNGEYGALVRAEGGAVHPIITMCEYGDPRFIPGAKTKVAKP